MILRDTAWMPEGKRRGRKELCMKLDKAWRERPERGQFPKTLVEDIEHEQIKEDREVF